MLRSATKNGQNGCFSAQDALALIRANFDRRLAANARPVYD